MENLYIETTNNAGAILKLEFTSRAMWTKNCHGDAYTYVTVCMLYNNGRVMGGVRAVLHDKDTYSPVIGCKVAMRKLFEKIPLTKALRTKFWVKLGLALNILK